MAKANPIVAKSRNAINRRSLLGAAAITAVAGVSSAKAASPVFAPTKLGRELLRAFPGYARALSLDVVKADYDAAHNRVWELRGAITDQAIISLSHLIDRAIVVRCFEWGDHDVDTHAAMVLWLLEKAGIPEAVCDIDNEAFQHPELARIQAEADAKIAAIRMAAPKVCRLTISGERHVN